MLPCAKLSHVHVCPGRNPRHFLRLVLLTRRRLFRAPGLKLLSRFSLSCLFSRVHPALKSCPSLKAPPCPAASGTSDLVPESVSALGVSPSVRPPAHGSPTAWQSRRAAHGAPVHYWLRGTRFPLAATRHRARARTTESDGLMSKPWPRPLL